MGIDFDDTSWELLERPAFLLVIAALAAASYALGRRAAATAGGPDHGAESAPVKARSEEAARPNPVDAVAMAPIGALLFGASLVEGGHAGWPGYIAGALCAVLGYFAVTRLFLRARGRLEAGAAGFLDLYAAAVAVTLAAASIFLPPVGYLALVAFAVLAVRSHAAAGRKYEGLRILR